MLAPRIPNGARRRTGNGTPYFVPAWPFRSMGTRTIRLPAAIVRSACHHDIPLAMRPEASM